MPEKPSYPDSLFDPVPENDAPPPAPKPRRDIFSTDWVGEDEDPFRPVPIPGEKPSDKKPLTAWQRVDDVIGAVNSGIGTAAHETFNFGAKYIGGGLQVGEQITNKVFGTDSNIAGEATDAVVGWADGQRKGDGSDWTPQTTAGNITQGAAQFVSAFVGAGKVMRAEKAFASLTTGGALVVQGAVADAVAFDPSQDRLSNLVQDFTEKHPSLREPVTSFLAANPEDSDAEGRLKNAIEGLVLGKVAEGLFVALRATRQAIKAHPKDADSILEKAADDLQVNESKATSEDPTGTPKPDEAPVPDKSANAPLLSPEGTEALFSRIKENPDWLTAGSVDKGRDFNFSKMDGPDGAKLAIDELSLIIAPQIEAAKGGIQPLRTIEDMADIIGTDPGQLMLALASHAKDAPLQAARMVAGKELLQSTARRVSDLARQLNGGHATAEVHAEFVTTANRMADLQTSLKAVQTGAARTTSAGRIRTRDSFSNADILSLMNADGNVKAVAMLTREKSTGAKLFDAFLSFRYSALLSNPVTHARNLIGSTLHTMALPIERTTGGALTGQRDVMKEGAHIAMSLDGAIWDSIKMAYKSLKTEEPILSPFVSKIETPRHAISAQAFDIQNPTMAGFIDAVGKFTRIPTRLLQAEDEFVKQLNYRAHVTAEATLAGNKKNLTGKALSNFIESERTKAFSTSGEGLNTRARDYAEVATFTNKPIAGGWTEGIEQFAGKHPAVRLFVPFIRTPSNIMKSLWFRTPGANLLSREFRDALKSGGAARADAVGKMATGALLWTAGMSLAFKGQITGGGPSDPRQRQTLLETGWRPYSFRVGNEFISYNGLDPLAMFFGLSADLADAGNYVDGKDFESVATAATMAMAKNLSSKTYLQGLSEALHAFTEPDRSMKRYLSNQLASLVPSGIKKVGGLIPGLEDPYMREVRSMTDALKNKVPGLSKTLPPKRNIFGEPMPILGAIGPDLVSPFFSNTLTNDPAALELARLGGGFSDPKMKVGNIDLSQVKNFKGQDAYDRWQELLQTATRGRKTLKQAIIELVTSSKYQRWMEAENSAEEAGKTTRTLLEVQALVQEFREAAFKNMLKEYPELAGAIKAQKQAGSRASGGQVVPKNLLDIINQLSP